MSEIKCVLGRTVMHVIKTESMETLCGEYINTCIHSLYRIEEVEVALLCKRCLNRLQNKNV